MRLKVSVAAANEQLLTLVTAGYQLDGKLRQDRQTKKATGTFNEQEARSFHGKEIEGWMEEVLTALDGIFPTDRECHVFMNPDSNLGRVSSDDYQWTCMMLPFMDKIKGLDRLRQTAIAEYTDLPIRDRLYVEDIDSFAKVRDVNPSMVAHILDDGFFNMSENEVKMALEQILNVGFHREDSPAELDDIYTANVIVNAARRATAFMLKGPGIKTKEMDIRHCGSKGTQLVRLFDAPADLFVVQFNGRISEMVIKDVTIKAEALRARKKQAHFVIIDGQDTARVLFAYGKIK